MQKITRSEFISMNSAAAVGFAFAPAQIISYANTKKQETMYGLIGSITTTEGQRDTFIEILLEGIADMPGCLNYIVAKDSEDENKIWITEVWDSKVSHKASLSLPEVQAAIAEGRPMIAGFGEQTETEPVGGHGYNDSSTSG